MSAKLPNPSATAMSLVDQFSWGSNVSRGGRLIGQQYVVAEAIDVALNAEREICANLVEQAARVLNAKRRTNKLDRFAIEQLVKCRDRIRQRAKQPSTPEDR